MSLKAYPTDLTELLVVEADRFGDHRGYFEETWNRRDWLEAGIDADFVQDNHSVSAQAGTLRGLHFQAPPAAQDKLVRCTRGAIYDVAVDIRRGSPDFGKWHGIELTPLNGLQLFIPKGFLHGFLTLNENTEVQYKCSAYYDSDCDGSVRWDSVGIAWPLTHRPVLSAKDEAAVSFSDFRSPFVYGAKL